MYRLVIPGGHDAALRDHLEQDDDRERCAFLWCTRAGDDRLLVAKVVPVPADRTDTCAGGVRPTPAFERQQYAACVAQGYDPVLVHSHPAGQPGFSGQDVAAITAYTDWLHGLWPDVRIGFGVFADDQLTATLYDPATERFHALPVAVVGDWPVEPDAPGAAAVDTALHDRTIRMVTEAAQRRLARVTVGVVGVGSLGFPIAKGLARMGVTRLVVVDPDDVARSNLNRLPGVTTADIGRPKVAVLADRLNESGLDVTVAPVQAAVEDVPAVLRQCDVVVGCADQVTTRAFLNEHCVRHCRYYLDAGVAIRIDEAADAVTAVEGVVQLVAPGTTACYTCLGRLDQERARRERLSAADLAEEVAEGYIAETELTPVPSVLSLNTVVAGLTETLVLRCLAPYAAPPAMLRYDDRASRLQAFATAPDPACPTCGETGILAQGDRDAYQSDVADLAATDLDLDLDWGLDRDYGPAPTTAEDEEPDVAASQDAAAAESDDDP